MDLRDFEGILLYFSQEEMEKLQAAIDKRRSRRLALNDETSPKPAEQSDYPPNGVEAVLSEVHIQSPV